MSGVTYTFEPISEDPQLMDDPDIRGRSIEYYRRRLYYLELADNAGIITYHHRILDQRRCRLECRQAGIYDEVFNGVLWGES